MHHICYIHHNITYYPTAYSRIRIIYSTSNAQIPISRFRHCCSLPSRSHQTAWSQHHGNTIQTRHAIQMSCTIHATSYYFTIRVGASQIALLYHLDMLPPDQTQISPYRNTADIGPKWSTSPALFTRIVIAVYVLNLASMCNTCNHLL